MGTQEQELVEIEALGRDPHIGVARAHVAEAVACYRRGALRSCVVMTWAAVVVDLLEKARALLLLVDEETRAGYPSLSAFLELDPAASDYEAAALEFESRLLLVAEREYGLLSARERAELETLRSDRDRARHPGLEPLHTPNVPSSAQARAHLRNALVYVLRRPTLQGEPAFAAFMRDVSAPFFPVELDAATSYLRESPLRNARDALLRRVVTALAERALGEALTADARVRTFAALSAISVTTPALTRATIGLEVSARMLEVPVEQRWTLLAFFANVPGSWNMVEESVRSVCKQYVARYKGERLLRVLHHAAAHPELTRVVIDRVAGLSGKQVRVLVVEGDIEVCCSRVVELFRTASTILAAEWIAARLLLPCVEHLSGGQVCRVVRAAHTNRNIYTSWPMLHELLPRLFKQTRVHAAQTGSEWWGVVDLLMRPELEPPELAEYGAPLVELITSELPERPAAKNTPWVLPSQPLLEDVVPVS